MIFFLMLEAMFDFGLSLLTLIALRADCPITLFSVARMFMGTLLARLFLRLTPLLLLAELTLWLRFYLGL